MMRPWPILLMLMLVDGPPAGEEITEIGLERTRCFGTCPVDEVIFQSDGTVRYVGKAHVDKVGKYKGKIDPAEFEKLARMMDKNKFFELKDDYSKPITDHPSLITHAKRAKATKKVDNYADAGPKELKEIEKAVLKLSAEVKWEKE